MLFILRTQVEGKLNKSINHKSNQLLVYGFKYIPLKKIYIYTKTKIIIN